MHFAGDLVMCLGDFNGHIGRNINNGFDGVHGAMAMAKVRGMWKEE